MINGHCLAGGIADSYLRIEESLLGPSPSHNVYCSGAAWCVMLGNVFLGKEPTNDAKTHMLHSTSRGNVIEDNLFLGHPARTPLAYAADFPKCSHTSFRRNLVIYPEGVKVVAVGAAGARPNALYRVPDCDNDPSYAEVYIEDNVFINFNAPNGPLQEDEVAPYKNAQAGWHVRVRRPRAAARGARVHRLARAAAARGRRTRGGGLVAQQPPRFIGRVTPVHRQIRPDAPRGGRGGTLDGSPRLR